MHLYTYNLYENSNLFFIFIKQQQCLISIAMRWWVCYNVCKQGPPSFPHYEKCRQSRDAWHRQLYRWLQQRKSQKRHCALRNSAQQRAIIEGRGAACRELQGERNRRGAGNLQNNLLKMSHIRHAASRQSVMVQLVTICVSREHVSRRISQPSVSDVWSVVIVLVPLSRTN